MDDGTTAFSMALGRKDCEMIRVFLSTKHESDIDPIRLAKRAIWELDSHSDPDHSYLRQELLNGLKQHGVSYDANEHPPSGIISEE